MEGADRLEIAVKGGRQAAFQKTPELAATVLREAGVVVEQQHGTFFEMPDHWIPYYLIQLSLRSRAFSHAASTDQGSSFVSRTSLSLR